MIEELLKDKYKENWIKFRRELFYRIKYNQFKITTGIHLFNAKECLETYNKRMYEKHKEFIYRNKVIFDIGSQFGDYSIIWNKIYHNSVYAFEPLINNFNISFRNMKLNYASTQICKILELDNEIFELYNGDIPFLFIFNCAIGNTKEINGIIKNNMLMQNFNGENYKSYKVQDLIPFTKPDMIKIDVEGFEIEVLKSLNSIINEHKPDFIIEVHSHFLRSEVIRLLKNYKIYYEDIMINTDKEYISILFMKVNE